MTASTELNAELYSAHVVAKIPLVSVLMPVFNAERYVEAAVRSVLNQSFRDFELVIVDDGSTDTSPSILKRLAALDSRIRLTTRENLGLVTTLNEMLSNARCELIARMDADDLCRPLRLQRQYSFLCSNSACVAVGSRSLFIDPDGLPIAEFIDRYTHEDIEKSLLKPEIGIIHPSVMFRRSAVAAVGGYRADYPHVEDLDLFLRLSEIGGLANLPDVLLEYRVHVESVSHKYTEAQSNAGLNAVKAAFARRGVIWDSSTLSIPQEACAGSNAQLHRKWAWWALAAGNLNTASKHTKRAVFIEPLSLLNIRLLACVARDFFKSLN